MINFIWTKRNQFFKAHNQCAQHFPSKQNKKRRAINLAMIKIFTLDYLEHQEIKRPGTKKTHFPMFPMCFLKSPKIWDFREAAQPQVGHSVLQTDAASALFLSLLNSSTNTFSCQARFWSTSPGTTKGIWEVMMMHYKQRPRKPQTSKAGTVMKR